MAPEEPIEDDDYASAEDSDFAPDEVAQEGSGESESELDDTSGKPKKNKLKSTKRKRGDEEAEDLGFENSGDEGIIKKGLRKKSKKEEEDDGGEGGFIKTRRQRAVECVKFHTRLRTIC
jgi:hypothetical protein